MYKIWLETKMCTNYDEQTAFNRFLWCNFTPKCLERFCSQVWAQARNTKGEVSLYH